MSELINGRTPEEIRFNIMECAHGHCLYECPYDSSDECVEDLLDDALAYIQHLEAQQPKWISVKDRLPEKPGPYLCWLCFCEMPIAMTIRYLGDGKWTMPESTISYWTDNPAPPEEE